MIKIKGLSQEEIKEGFPYHRSIVCYRGSITHGMYIPQEDPNTIDDKDLMGIVIAPLDKYFGLSSFEGCKDKFVREYDIVIYEYRKFVRLLLKNNPNVLSVLWLHPKHYIHVDWTGRKLIENRDLFTSLQAYHSFTGYAFSQLKRMESFGKCDKCKGSGGVVKQGESYKSVQCGKCKGKGVRGFDGYMGDKRKQLVEKFHFGTKNASHLIRLLRMGIEFLKEGVLYVEREDASELLDIKKGKWSLQQVKDHADELFKLAREAYQKSDLPPKPATKKIEKLMMDVFKAHFQIGI